MYLGPLVRDCSSSRPSSKSKPGAETSSALRACLEQRALPFSLAGYGHTCVSDRELACHHHDLRQMPRRNRKGSNRHNAAGEKESANHGDAPAVSDTTPVDAESDAQDAAAQHLEPAHAIGEEHVLASMPAALARKTEPEQAQTAEAEPMDGTSCGELAGRHDLQALRLSSQKPINSKTRLQTRGPTRLCAATPGHVYSLQPPSERIPAHVYTSRDLSIASESERALTRLRSLHSPSQRPSSTEPDLSTK